MHVCRGMLRRVSASLMVNGRTDTAGPLCIQSQGGTGMLIPTTPGRLDRVLARITTTRPRSASRVLRGPLLATLLAIAAVALTGALATPRVDAAQPPPGPRTYKVTADLDGRLSPINRPGAIVAVDFLLKGQRVPIECQKY